MEKEKPKIIYDIRESKSLVIENLKEKCILEEKLLDAGDYLLSDRICCERKTTIDFARSIIDGRLFSQIKEMKNYFEFPLLIIEGLNLYEEENIRPEAIQGAIAAVTIDLKTPIIWTKTSKETAEMLLIIAKREQLEMKRKLKIRFEKKPIDVKEQQEYLVAGLPFVDRERAKILLKHFGCPEFVFTASEKELTKVKGIGKNIAKKIRLVLETEYK